MSAVAFPVRRLSVRVPRVIYAEAASGALLKGIGRAGGYHVHRGGEPIGYVFRTGGRWGYRVTFASGDVTGFLTARSAMLSLDSAVAS